MLKVAVLLRGQPRFAKEGAHFFNKFVIENHPDVEFKFFAHAWNTMSRRMISSEDTERVKDRALPIVMSKVEVAELLSHWNPVSALIESEADNLKLAGEIINTNTFNETETFEWFRKYIEFRDISIHDLCIGHHRLLMPMNIDMNRVFTAHDIVHNNDLQLEMIARVRYDQIKLSYLLGQMYSAGKSFALLQEYSLANDYMPDIVISTRYDIASWFYNFEKLARELEHTKKAKMPIIFTWQVSCSNGNPIVDDYTFIGPMLPFVSFLSDIRRRLHNKLTSPIFNRFDLISSGSHIQHQLWTKICDDNLRFNQPSTIHWEANLIRPVEFPTELPSYSKPIYTRLVEKLNTYEYPEPGDPLTFDDMINLYNTLSRELK